MEFLLAFPSVALAQDPRQACAERAFGLGQVDAMWRVCGPVAVPATGLDAIGPCALPAALRDRLVDAGRAQALGVVGASGADGVCRSIEALHPLGVPEAERTEPR